MNGFRAAPFTAGERQLPVGIRCCLEMVEGFDQPDVVFGRMLQPRDIEEKRALQAPQFRRLFFRRRAVTGLKSLVVYAQVDDVLFHDGDT